MDGVWLAVEAMMLSSFIRWKATQFLFRISICVLTMLFHNVFMVLCIAACSGGLDLVDLSPGSLDRDKRLKD